MEKKIMIIALMPIICVVSANGNTLRTTCLRLPNDTLKTISTTVTCYDTKADGNASEDSCENVYKTVTTNTVVFKDGKSVTTMTEKDNNGNIVKQQSKPGGHSKTTVRKKGNKTVVTTITESDD